MLINKYNNHISINLENGTVILYDSIEDKKNTLCIDFKAISSVTENAMVISNPGEYEIFSIITRVSKTQNVFISVEGIKISYISNTSELIDSKDIDSGDIIIFDINNGSSAKMEDIIKIEKDIQPKVLIINSSIENLTHVDTYEKVSKLKIKKNELDLIVDTKMYLM